MANDEVDIMATLIFSENIANNIFQIILLNVNVLIFIKISLQYIPLRPIVHTSISNALSSSIFP